MYDRLQKNRVPIILIMLLLMIVVFILQPGWGLLMFLLFGGWYWSDQVWEGKQKTVLEPIWSELARETGLTFFPGKHSFLGGSPPTVRGEYRGVPISIEYVIEDSGVDYDSVSGFTKILVLVKNSARFSLEMSGRSIYFWGRGKGDVLSWKKEFDRRFRVRGTPQEFVRRAIRLADLIDILLLDKSQSKVLKTYLFYWSSYCRPSITLKGSDLICRVQGVYTRVDAQITMLNLLCDLAQLAERMGNEGVP